MEEQSPYRKLYRDEMSMDSQLAPGGIIVYYADGGEEIIHVNQYVVDLFDCETVDEFLDYVQGSFRGFVHGEDIDAAEDSIWGQVGENDSFDHIYYRIKTKAGRLVSIEDFGRLVERPGERPVFYVFIAEMTEGYNVDWLTGLPDMPRFQELARMGVAAIEARGERPAIVALDLIGLKSYNAQYGRAEGDALLQHFGDVLRKHFGSEACSRFAEDHFYAFAPVNGLDERLEALFADFEGTDERKVLPVRVGAYACDPGDDIVEVALDRAKIACDLDRKTWRSHAFWFNDELREAAQLNIHILEHVDDAIEQGWVHPYYQSIVRAATGAVCAEEALARWIDPEFGMISPAQFIPVLEEAGLLYKLDMHMISCVLADMAKKREQGIALVPVSVNLSQRDLQIIDVVEEVVDMAAAAGVPLDLLRVEFTESAASINPEFFRTRIDALRSAGLHVWMDDFGSEYSSLNTLHEYDFDLVKLDMGFMGGFPDDKKTLDIIEGVIRTAGIMGVDTLAEGVETEEQAVFLESIGCDMLQGYLYAQPQPLDAILERHRDGTARPREPYGETGYWDAIGTLNLIDPALDVKSSTVAAAPFSDIPVGVFELRDGAWRILRANGSFRTFLNKAGVLPDEAPNQLANLTGGAFDKEFMNAVERSSASHSWEQITGRLEDGSGYQFFVRAVASTEDADAYKIAGVPTHLGSGLGTFGDVPVSYAVFRVLYNEAGDEVVDLEFVYSNRLYCDRLGVEPGSLNGKSYLKAVKGASSVWFPYFYHAAALGEEISDTIYSPEIGRRLRFNVAPSRVEGYCTFAFMIVGDVRREHSANVAD